MNDAKLCHHFGISVLAMQTTNHPGIMNESHPYSSAYDVNPKCLHSIHHDEIVLTEPHHTCVGFLARMFGPSFPSFVRVCAGAMISFLISFASNTCAAQEEVAGNVAAQISQHPVPNLTEIVSRVQNTTDTHGVETQLFITAKLIPADNRTPSTMHRFLVVLHGQPDARRMTMFNITKFTPRSATFDATELRPLLRMRSQEYATGLVVSSVSSNERVRFTDTRSVVGLSSGLSARFLKLVELANYQVSVSPSSKDKDKVSAPDYLRLSSEVPVALHGNTSGYFAAEIQCIRDEFTVDALTFAYVLNDLLPSRTKVIVKMSPFTEGYSDETIHNFCEPLYEDFEMPPHKAAEAVPIR